MKTFQFAGPKRFDHQRRGLKKLLDGKGVGALLFDPGTGKTATALDYLSILALKSARGEARVLVVCPLAAVDTWVLQAEQYVSPQVDYWAEALGGTLVERAEALAARGDRPFRGSVTEAHKKRGADRALHHRRAIYWGARAEGAPEVPTPQDGPASPAFDHTGRPRIIIEVVNLDTFSYRHKYRSGTIADRLLEGIKRFEPDAVIIDESHRIKSPTSNVSRFMARLSDHVPRRIMLTGTAMPVGPIDVFAQWRFMAPNDLGPPGGSGAPRRRATYSGFKDRFTVEGGFMGREVIGYKNLDDLQEIMAERAVVAKKEDALDLPKTSDITVPVHLAPAEERAYEEMKEHLAATFSGDGTATAENRLVQMLRLRQITSGHLPDDDGDMQQVGQSKADVIASLVNDTLAGEKRIVVFCFFTSEIEMLRRMLDKAGTEVMVIAGSTSGKDRMRMRHRFGTDDPQRMVLVAQVKTLSLAVNELVTANHAIFGSLSQQRDDLVQARDRLDRIGQTRPVTFWYCLAHGSIDEVIYQTHMERGNLERAVLDHIMDRSVVR